MAKEREIKIPENRKIFKGEVKMKEKCECLICDWFAIQDKYGNLEQVKCNKCGKDLLFSYRSHLLQELKEKVEKRKKEVFN